ncbi:MAG: nucleoside recognition protein [Lachnospiraceae bacterium]|nr:nucleoside recognition protein [Lachnospiraceae bacterium]
MLNYLWAGMLIFGVLWGVLQGKGAELTQAVLDGGRSAVELSLTLLGAMAIWTGLMEIAEKCGILQGIHRLLRPVIRWLFPDLPEDHPATESISMNFAANILGLGNAATPAALKAMKELQELQTDKYTASDEMCTFLIINISSLQLIPINMIIYRSQYGSVNPAMITVPVLIATVASTVVGVVMCKVLRGRRA